MINDEVLENAIKCYKITRETALDEVVYECLKELQELRNNNDTAYNQALDDIMDSLKNEWTIDSILCATDKYKLLAIFKRIEKQLRSEE